MTFEIFRFVSLSTLALDSEEIIAFIEGNPHLIVLPTKKYRFKFVNLATVFRFPIDLCQQEMWEITNFSKIRGILLRTIIAL